MKILQKMGNEKNLPNNYLMWLYWIFLVSSFLGALIRLISNDIVVAIGMIVGMTLLFYIMKKKIDFPSRKELLEETIAFMAVHIIIIISCIPVITPLCKNGTGVVKYIIWAIVLGMIFNKITKLHKKPAC